MDLHGRIMNIQVDKKKLTIMLHDARSAYPSLDVTDEILETIYLRVHRDAIHAAAELVAESTTHFGVGEPMVVAMPEADPLAVHASHCCKVCGCRYGDETCPVVTGEVEQAFDCEDCEADKRQREEIISKYEEPLRAYEVLIGVDQGSLNLAKLINIQMKNREWWSEFTKERNDMLAAARGKGLADGRALALEHNHVSVERLRKMTIDEICALVNSSEPEQADDNESFYRTNEDHCE